MGDYARGTHAGPGKGQKRGGEATFSRGHTYYRSDFLYSLGQINGPGRGDWTDDGPGQWRVDSEIKYISHMLVG